MFKNPMFSVNVIEGCTNITAFKLRDDKLCFLSELQKFSEGFNPAGGIQFPDAQAFF